MSNRDSEGELNGEQHLSTMRPEASKSRSALIMFFFVAFGVGGGAWVLKWAMNAGWEGWGLVLFYIGAVSPSVAGLLAVFIERGKDGVCQLLNDTLRIRAHAGWWAYLTLVPLTWALASSFLYLVLDGQGGGSIDPAAIASWFTLHTLTMLIPPIGEELGWRGYLLPRLHRKYSALLSAVLTGLIWAPWHFPLYIDRIQSGGLTWTLSFTFVLVCFSILLAVIYFRTRSLFLVILMHFAINLVQERQLVPDVLTNLNLPLLMFTSSIVIVIVAVVAADLWLRGRSYLEAKSAS